MVYGDWAMSPCTVPCCSAVISSGSASNPMILTLPDLPAFDELGATVRNFSGSIGAMSGGQKQAVAVARAAAWAKRVILLDEPTAALGVVQTKSVLDLIRRVRDRGLGVVFVSHQMPAVLQVADDVQVMRLGRRVATFRAQDTTMEELVGAMTGAVTQDDATQENGMREIQS